MATPPKLTKTVPGAGDQMFTCVRLGGAFLIQTILALKGHVKLGLKEAWHLRILDTFKNQLFYTMTIAKYLWGLCSNYEFIGVKLWKIFFFLQESAWEPIQIFIDWCNHGVSSGRLWCCPHVASFVGIMQELQGYNEFYLYFKRKPVVPGNVCDSVRIPANSLW